MPAQSATSAVDDDIDVYYDGAEDAGAYYTAKLTFFHDFPVKVWGAYYTNVCIIFEILRYYISAYCLFSLTFACCTLYCILTESQHNN